jgi:hypothetical protein
LAELLGQAAHLRRIADWLVPLVQLLVSRRDLFDFGFGAAQFGSALGPAVFDGELGEPVQRDQVGWIGRDQTFERSPFSLDVGTLSRKPGRQLFNLRGS